MEAVKVKLDWIGLDWIGLDWIGLIVAKGPEVQANMTWGGLDLTSLGEANQGSQWLVKMWGWRVQIPSRADSMQAHQACQASRERGGTFIMLKLNFINLRIVKAFLTDELGRLERLPLLSILSHLHSSVITMFA